jgi:hypothetical protein
MWRNNVKRIILALGALSFLAMPASAGLVNGNFDTATTVIPEGSANCAGTIGFPGWNSFGFSCGTGQFNPSAASYPGGNAPSNDYVAYHNGTSGFWQTSTTDVWTAGTMHMFYILVGQRFDEPYLGYQLELWAGDPTAGGTQVAVQSTTGAVPAPGAWVPKTLSYTPTGTESFLGQNVTVVFRGGTLSGIQTNFDNAELVSTPEPATYALMGLSLLGIATLRRRRRRV